MTLQQLRSIHEVVRHGMNISAAARALNNTPPNVSRYIRMLEDELAVRMFQRAGGKLTGLTLEGAAIMEMVGDVLNGVDGVQRLAQGMRHAAAGVLTIGSADMCASSALSPLIARFKQDYPDVLVNVLRGSSQEMSRLVAEGGIDFALVTEHITRNGDLVSLPYACHELSVVTAQRHQLHDGAGLSLETLAEYPLATYVTGHAGRVSVDAAFAAAGVVPDIAYASNDADFFKSIIRGTNVVGVLCGGAYDAALDGDLVVHDAAGLFAPVTAYVCLRRDSLMRRYGYGFIEMLAPHLSYGRVLRALSLRDMAQVAELLGPPPPAATRRAVANVMQLPCLKSAAPAGDVHFACRSIAT
ncbi:MAG: LysR substrate-binding domain-containing protein [Pseudomonadota bacterium]